MRKIIALIVLTCVLSSFVCVSVSYAQEEQQENAVIKFFKNVVNWPLNITKKGSEAVGRTTKRAVEIPPTTAAAAVDTVTGRPERAKTVVVEPVVGTAETAKEAVVGTVTTPIEGTTETFER
ncbi:MAG: hypothetical protein V2A72_08605 [Candidatus Omnitrophota bacterium]